jgi:hypothetical protein
LLLQQDDGRAGFIAQTPITARLATLVKEDVVGFNIPHNTEFKVAGMILVIFSIGLLIWRATQSERRALALPLTVGLGALISALFAALAGFDFINTRNMLVFWPALVIVLAGGLGIDAAGRAGTVILACFTVLFLSCLITMIDAPLYQRGNWRGVARSLGSTPIRRAIVGDMPAGVSLAPYMPDLSLMHRATVRVDEVDVFALALSPDPPTRNNVAFRISGFHLSKRVETTTYTLFRYRAGAPLAVSRSSLLSLGLLGSKQRETVLLQSP